MKSKIALAVLSSFFLLAASAMAQTTTRPEQAPSTTPAIPTPLPPEAQDALKRGVLAAKSQDFLLAIRYFEDARKVAPNAPAVKDQIVALEVQSQSKIKQLIDALKNMVRGLPDDPRTFQLPNSYRLVAQQAVAMLYACAGDEDEAVLAIKSHDASEEESYRKRGLISEGSSYDRDQEAWRYYAIVECLAHLENLPAAKTWLNRLAQLSPEKAKELGTKLNEEESKIARESAERRKKGVKERVERWIRDLEDEGGGYSVGPALKHPLFTDVSGYLRSLSEGRATTNWSRGIMELPKLYPRGSAVRIFWEVCQAVDGIIAKQLKVERSIREQSEQ